jgi:hypothetical protein
MRRVLAIGATELGSLQGSTAVIDAGGHIDGASDSIIVAWGVVDILSASNCLVIAGADVTVSVAENCTILSGGVLSVMESSNCTLGGAELLNAHSARKRSFFVNSQFPEPGLALGEFGEVTNMEVPGLALGAKALTGDSLADKLTPTYMSKKLLLFKVPGQPGEFVARPNEELLDPFGKPAPELAGWKLIHVTSRLAAFEKDKERRFVRWNRK